MSARGKEAIRRRNARLEAARYGEMASTTMDSEELIFSVGRSDHKKVDLCKFLLNDLLASRTSEFQMLGHQSFSELLEPPMTASLSAVAPAAATEIVLWTPSATTITQTFYPQGFWTRIGQQAKIRVAGIMTVPATAGTFTMNPRYGTTTAGVALGASAAIAAGTVSQTNVPWLIQWHGVMRGPLNSATAVYVGVGTFESNGVARDAVFGGAIASVDSTTAQGQTFDVTMSVASYSFTPLNIETEIVG